MQHSDVQLPFWVMNARGVSARQTLGLALCARPHHAQPVLYSHDIFSRQHPRVFINFDASAAAVYTILDLVPQVLMLLVISPRVLKNMHAFRHRAAQLGRHRRVLGEMDDVERLQGQLKCVKSSLKIAMRDCDSELKTGKKKIWASGLFWSIVSSTCSR